MMSNPHSHHTDGTAEEDAYRRGFDQGSHAVIAAIIDGASLEEIKRWKTSVSKWRHDRTHHKMTEPPKFAMENKSRP